MRSIKNGNRGQNHKRKITMNIIRTSMLRRLIRGIIDSLISTIIIIAMLKRLTLNLRISSSTILVASKISLDMLSNKRKIDRSKGTDSTHDRPTIRILIIRDRLSTLMTVLIIRMIGSIRQISMRTDRPLRRIIMLNRGIIMVRHVTLSNTVLKTSLLLKSLIGATIRHMRRTLNRINTNTRRLRLLTSTRKKRTTNSTMIITIMGTRRIIILMLSQKTNSEDLNTRLLRILKRANQPRGNRIKLKTNARILRHIRMTMTRLNGRHATIGARTTSKLNSPLQITNRRNLMLKNANRLSRTRLRSRIVRRLLSLLLDRNAINGITLDMSIGRHKNATSKRDNTILLLSNDRMNRMRPLSNLLHINDEIKGVRAVNLNRRLRLTRNAGLLLRLLTVASIINNRSHQNKDLLNLLILSRMISAMRNSAAMITSSTTTTVTVKRANSSIDQTTDARLKNMSVGSTNIINLTLRNMTLSGILISLMTILTNDLTDSTSAAISIRHTLRQLINLRTSSNLLLTINIVSMTDKITRSAHSNLNIRVRSTTLLTLLGRRIRGLTPRLLNALNQTNRRQLITLMKNMILLSRISSIGLSHPSTFLRTFPYLLRYMAALLIAYGTTLSRATTC